MKIATVKLFLLALLAIAIIACNRVSDNSARSDLSFSQSAPLLTNCRSIAHLAGETQICDQPQKVAVIGSNLLEILLKLNVQPAGFADYFVFRQEYYDRPSQQIPYLGDHITSQPANLGQFFNPSLEALLKLKPDLILGSEFNQAQYPTLSNIAPTLLFNWFDSATAVSAIAQAVGQPETSKKLTLETQQKIVEAKDHFASTVAEHPRVILMALQGQNIELFSKSDSCTSLIENLGFQLIYPPDWNAENAYNPPLSLESLPQLGDADSIILYGTDATKFDSFKDINDFEQHQLNNLEQIWKQNAIAQSLKASQAGRVYFIPTYLCRALPGPIGTELYLNKLQKQLLPTH